MDDSVDPTQADQLLTIREYFLTLGTVVFVIGGMVTGTGVIVKAMRMLTDWISDWTAERKAKIAERIRRETAITEMIAEVPRLARELAYNGTEALLPEPLRNEPLRKIVITTFNNVDTLSKKFEDHIKGITPYEEEQARQAANALDEPLA